MPNATVEEAATIHTKIWEFMQLCFHDHNQKTNIVVLVKEYNDAHGKEMNAFFNKFLCHLPAGALTFVRLAHAILLWMFPASIYAFLDGTQAKMTLINAVREFMQTLRLALIRNQPNLISRTEFLKFCRPFGRVRRLHREHMDALSRSSTPVQNN